MGRVRCPRRPSGPFLRAAARKRNPWDEMAASIAGAKPPWLDPASAQEHRSGWEASRVRVGNLELASSDSRHMQGVRMMRISGTVKWFSEQRGHGFVLT